MAARRSWRSVAGGVSALAAAALLLVGVGGLVAVKPALRPWLAVLLGINAGLAQVSMGSLKVVNAIDVAVLALSSIAFLGLWPGPVKPHKVWMGLAVALPIAGIGVLIATGLAGRSGLMGGGLVLSALMLGDRRWRPVGVVGLAANALLLVGDFATVGRFSTLVTAVVGAGYVLIVAWFIWIGNRQLGAAPSKT